MRRTPTSTLFPTRRSSDLELTLAQDTLQTGFAFLARNPGAKYGATSTEYDGLAVEPSGPSPEVAGWEAFKSDQRQRRAYASRDRKSTRLNSSHGYISQAVC